MLCDNSIKPAKVLCMHAGGSSSACSKLCLQGIWEFHYHPILLLCSCMATTRMLTCPLLLHAHKCTRSKDRVNWTHHIKQYCQYGNEVGCGSEEAKG